MTTLQLRLCLTLLLLATCSGTDLRRQQVFLPVPAAGILTGLCLTAWCGDITWLSGAGGIAAGVLLVLFGYVTKGAFGSGDGWVLAGCGSLLGIVRSMSLLLTASLLSLPVSAVLLLTHQKRKTDTVPFVPFLLAAFVWSLFF